MAEARKPRLRCPVERRIQVLFAAKTLHRRRREAAQLEREVAALDDPETPSTNELAGEAANARAQAILRDMAAIEAACNRRPG
ncbi:hypothetical protein [Caulobacter sp. LARHSG274]